MIATGFISFGLQINTSLIEWDSNPTLTTLETIAAPISQVQFPTVTVCPDPYANPDNWAYPEILLNSLSFECYENDPRFPDCSKTEELRKDFKQLFFKLHKEMEGRIGKIEQFANDPKDPYYFGILEALSANLINLGKMKTLAVDKLGIVEDYPKLLNETVGERPSNLTCDQGCMAKKGMHFLTASSGP